MSPLDVQDILERAKYSAQVGDHEEAEKLLKNYLIKIPDSREARLLLGTTFAREGKLGEAADEFITLLGNDPQDLEALNNAAVIYRRQGKLDKALDYLKEAIDIDPTKAEFFYNLGNIHKQMGNSKAASMAYSKVIELDPNYVSAYNNLGTIYDQLKEYNKAYDVFRKGLSLDQNNPTLRFNYGVALEANGHLEDAANEYRAALRSKPGWLAPMNNLGIVQFKQGRHDKAISTFNHVLTSDPINAEAFNNIGVVLADQGKTKEAIKYYRRAIESDQKYTKAVLNLERSLENSGDFADAVVELEKLVKLSPDSAEIRNRLAGLYLKLERYPEALEQADSALDWEPESIQALRIKGAVQRVMGNDDKAEKCFEKILSLDPGNYAFLLDLADINFRRKEYKEAEERIQSYLIRRPGDREAKLLLGKLYAEMGNRTHAIQVFEELSKADPNDSEALAATAELHKEAGSLEKALRAADSLVNLQGKRATADDLLDLNKSLEFYENAVNAYSTSVREMWDRNIKLMAGGEQKEEEEEDISMFMGAQEISRGIDEETEALFTEGLETLFREEENDDVVFGDDTFSELPEEEEPVRHRDPLDALADDSQEAFPELSRTAQAPSAGQGRGQEAVDYQSGPEPMETIQAPQPPPPPQPSSPPPKYPEYGGKTMDNAPRGMAPGETSSVPPDESQDSLMEEFPGEEFEVNMDDDISEAGFEEPGLDGSGEAESVETFPDEPYSPEPDPDFLDFSEETQDLVPDLEEAEPDIPDIDNIEDISDIEDIQDIEDIPDIEDISEIGDIPDIGDIQGIPDAEDNPEMVSGSSEPVSAEPIEMFSELNAGEEADNDIKLAAVIELLSHLQLLTEKLPKKEWDSYINGRFPNALESVIDSLKKLIIIKD